MISRFDGRFAPGRLATLLAAAVCAIAQTAVRADVDASIHRSADATLGPNVRTDNEVGLAAPALLDSRPACGQIPGVGALSPFPINLRLGAMFSPRTKGAVGVDVSISGLHLLP